MSAPTFEDWLSLMPLVAARGWSGDEEFAALRDRDGRCPLCALAYELSDGHVDRFADAWLAVAELGVTDEARSIVEIAKAADMACDYNRPALMQALGMTA